MLELIKHFITIFKLTYKEELDKLQQKCELDIKSKEHFYRFVFDDKYRETVQLNHAKMICKRFEEVENGTKRNNSFN